MQGARERRVGDHRHVVFLGDAPDLRGDQVLALGHHLGRGARAVVGERDGVVRGVGDDDVGVGNRRHHARAGGLHLTAALRGSDLGGDPVLAGLVFDFLLGHHQLLLVAVALPRVVDQPDQQVGEGGVLGDAEGLCPASAARPSGGMPTMAASGVSPGSSASAATPPTMATLTTALIASKTALAPSRFFRPEAGLMPLKSGLSACALGLKPTCATPPRTPPSRHAPKTGAIAKATVETRRMQQVVEPCRGRGLRRVGDRAEGDVEHRRARVRDPRPHHARSRTARRRATTAPLRSLLRATWPFSRARLRCLGVAFSVRSSRGIVQATCSEPRAAPTLTES